MADVLRRRAALAAGVFAAVLAGSAAVLFLSHPVYRAEARLKIGEPPPTAGVSPTGGLLSFLRTGGDPFANDLEILSSRSLAERVVREAALSVRLRASRGWYRDSVFVALALQDTTTKAEFEATWAGEGVRVRRISPGEEDMGTFATGAPAVFGGMRVVFAARRPGAPESVRIRTIPFDEAVRLTARKLKVRRTRREANVLEVSYALNDPAVASAVVESAVRNFLALRIGIFERESRETVDSLRSASEETRRDLAQAEDSLEAIQRRTGLVATDAQSEALIERYEGVWTALEEARAERSALESQAARAGDRSGGVAAWSAVVAHPRFLENPTVGELLTKLTELEEARTALLSMRRPESADARTLDAQIAQLEDALEALVTEYRTALGERIIELESRVETLDGVLDRLPAETIELGRRHRSVRLLSEILILTEQRLRQEELRQALAFSNLQVIDPPRLRYRPVWPRPKLGLAVAGVLAFGSALLGIVVVERADPTVRRAARIRELTGASVLAAARPDLSPAELQAVRGVARGAGTLVLCAGVDAGTGRRIAEATGLEGPATVAGYAEAASLARDGGTVVLAVRVGHTSEHEVDRTVRLLREAGASPAGTVAFCRSPREERLLWD
jgi:uncharacterized protein involved in exopolysaccharide biosynthesis